MFTLYIVLDVITWSTKRKITTRATAGNNVGLTTVVGRQISRFFPSNFPLFVLIALCFSFPRWPSKLRFDEFGGMEGHKCLHFHTPQIFIDFSRFISCCASICRVAEIRKGFEEVFVAKQNFFMKTNI